jgi:hypothetical protein
MQLLSSFADEEIEALDRQSNLYEVTQPTNGSLIDLETQCTSFALLFQVDS